MQRFFEEVIRRKVLPVAIAYAIGGWLLLQVGDVLIGLLELPGATGKILVALVAVGLPVAIFLSWVYGWTPKDGTGGIVLIGGGPGVGKSRLAEEALATGRDMELLPLTGHAYEDCGAPFITSSVSCSTRCSYAGSWQDLVQHSWVV